LCAYTPAITTPAAVDAICALYKKTTALTVATDFTVAFTGTSWTACN